MIATLGRRRLSFLWFFLTVTLMFTSGCLHRQLEFTARRAMNTLPDLHYQQVMDNLAAIAANPARLPYLAVVGQGAVQVTDNATTALGLVSPVSLAKPDTFGFNSTRNVTGTWSLGTITSPDKIRAMQAVYQRAVAGSAHREPAHLWLKIGGKRDVPSAARHTGRHGDVAVWVMPEGVGGLSELTLAILDIATRDDTAPALASPADERQGGVPRRNFQLPATGPVFTPGGG